MNEELILAEVNEVAQDNVDIVQDGLTAETSEVETKVAEFDSELDNDILMEEPTVDVLYVGPMEEIEIEVDEAIGWVSGDTGRHYGLPDRNDPDQHIIESITDLREELDEIESLKTVYSDKHNVANYYEWNDGVYDETGYFVSIVPKTSKIKICEGSDIFGVSVEAAGFVGNEGYTEVKNTNGVVIRRTRQSRNNSYALVVTSGLVDVRCESEVNVGDYVTSNERGYAKKSSSNFGYKVLATEDKNGIAYAIISLGVQADRVDALGEDLQIVRSKVNTNEQNIVSAINVANQAYSQSTECGAVSEEAIRQALEAMQKADGAIDVTNQMNNTLTSLSATAIQAKAIAESAATSAEGMKNEAVAKANEALADTTELREDFESMEEGITELENQINVIAKENSDNGAAIAGISVQVSDHNAKINNLVSWQGNTNIAMARIEQKADANGAYIQSTVSNMDKYAVGPNSLAYGFTLEQAASVLEEGMIYVPTESVTETYGYTDGDGNIQTYSRSFTPGYLYKWGTVDGQYRWITVDKNYDETTETNVSSQAVYFKTTEPIVGDNFGYWYTNGDSITGTTGTYEPYTLYKWDSYINENDETRYHWVAVATLAGNSQSRAISQVKQTANSIELNVTAIDDKYAGTKMWVDNNSANIQDVVTWKGENADSSATFMAPAEDNFASASQVAQIVDKDGNINAASIVTAVTEDESSIALLADNITLDASQIKISGETTFDSLLVDGTTTIDGANIATGTLHASQITTGTLDASQVTITNLDASQITTGTLDADRIATDAIKSKNYSTAYSMKKVEMGFIMGLDFGTEEILAEADTNTVYYCRNANLTYIYAKYDNDEWVVTRDAQSLPIPDAISGSFLNLADGTFNSKNFTIDVNGNVAMAGVINAQSGGSVGGWDITEDGIEKGSTKLLSNNRPQDSLVDTRQRSPMRISVGESPESELITYNYVGSLSEASSFSIEHDTGYDNVSNVSAVAECYEDEQVGLYIPDGGISVSDGIIHINLVVGKVNSPYSGKGYTVKIQYMANVPHFRVLEDGSMYAGAVDIRGHIEADSGKIGNLRIQNDGLEGYLSQSSSEIRTFTLNSNGLIIPNDSARVQVGDISLRQDNARAVFSAQGAVSLQAEGADGPVAYIRFGGANASESDASNEAQIWVYALATGDVWNPKMKFYAISTSALPVARRITLYYNIATWGSNYPTLANETTLIIQAGAYSSDEYFISATYDVFDRYLRFSKDITEVQTANIKPRNFGSTSTSGEICMTSTNDINAAMIKYETFTWSDSSNNFLVNGNILLDEGRTGNLGSPDSPWSAVFAKSFGGDVATTGIVYTDSGTVDGSDRNIKKDIEALPDVYGEVFDSLAPVRYKYKNGTSDRYHTGFIAQDVLDAVESAGLTSKDFAAYCAWEKADGESTSGLRYDELIALCVNEIQKLKKRVAELEKEKNE